MRTAAMMALAVALIAPTARADLPAGWIAGGKAAPMPAEAPPSPRSREALQISAQPPRPALDPVPIALDAFDVVDIPPPLTAQQVEASNADAPGEAPAELILDRGCAHATVGGHQTGEITVGWMSGPLDPGATRGVSLWHVRGTYGGDGVHRYARIGWETIDRQPDGTLRFTEAAGRFETRTCKAKIATRMSAVARPILGGLAYLFRTRCAACAPGKRETLHVIRPNSGWGIEAYDHTRIDLSADTAGSSRVQIERPKVLKFAATFGVALPAPAVGDDLLLGIEVVKGLGEAAPSAIAYATEVRHVGF
jgi:hypothetical protein